MSGRSYRDSLAAERAVNERYLRLCDEEEARRGRLRVMIAAATNVIWGGFAPNPPGPGRSGPLIGRVALDVEDNDLRDFYVVPVHVDGGALQFFSWRSPIGKLFYEGRGWDPARIPNRESAPDPGSLLGRRSFEARADDIVGFADDLEPGTDQYPDLRRRASPLVIPPPPSAAPLRPTGAGDGARPPKDPPPPTAVSTAEPPEGEPPRTGGSAVEPPNGEPPGEEPPGDTGALRTEPNPPEPPAARHSDEQLERAAPLVRRAIEGPRDTRLHEILRTLQPDQYRFVSWPADVHLCVQGHPGTGKTIVATHRAAFLTHPGDPGGAGSPDRLRRVALVGPTDEWASHVFGVLDETGARGVEVLSMETLIRGLADGQLARDRRGSGLTHPLHREIERPFQTDWALGRIADRAVADLAAELSRTTDSQQKMRLVTLRIVEACATEAPLVTDLTPECREWLRAARSFDHARNDASYLLFLAGVGMAIQPPSNKALYEQLIVDEVQDLRPAEWRILDALLRGDGNWSLFGDMNQRRADVSWDSWAALTSHLGLGPEDGSSPEPETLHTGYRSNDAILRYASWLLSRSERNQRSLRGGADDSVRVRRVRPAALLTTAEEEARILAEEFSEGVVAVIVWSKDSHDRMRDLALECGWRRAQGPTNRTTFTLREPPAPGAEPGRRATLRILRAVQARGLEFDGVVVVEPADFQKNLGRHGSLYTSLTRANKKLVVVHSSPLPQELRGRVRSDPARR